MSQMHFDGIAHLSPEVRRQAPEIFDGFRGQDDQVAHSGQIVARLVTGVNLNDNPEGYESFT